MHLLEKHCRNTENKVRGRIPTKFYRWKSEILKTNKRKLDPNKCPLNRKWSHTYQHMGTGGQRKGQGPSAHSGGGSSAGKARGGQNPTSKRIKS